MNPILETRRVIQGYHARRAQNDAPGSAAFLAQDVEFQSPMMQFSGAGELVAALTGFQPLVLAYRMISELYGEGEGTLIYDLETATPAGVQRTAEHFCVWNGEITSIVLIFDATRWRPILTAAQAQSE